MQVYRNYIKGEWVPSTSGKTIVDINPANTDEIIGTFQQSTEEDVKRAIAAAAEAFLQWRDYPPGERSKILREAHYLMIKKEDELARTITREEGKTLREAKAEVQSAIKEMEFQIGEGERLYGETIPSKKKGILSYTVRQPLGVVSIISPWNFPLNVPSRKVTPALLAGNTVVFKPASFTPLIGLKFVEILVEAGLPEGVINFITGSGSAIGDELINNPAVKAISFTGSTEIGRKIYQQASGRMIKVQLEMGGKNPLIVLEDADLELAARDTILAAFSCSGQWCTSTSRVIVMEQIKEKFTELLQERAKEIRVGNGLHPEISMGPLAGEAQLRKVEEYIELGKKEGAHLLWGGNRLTGAEYNKGFFLEPTIFIEVKKTMRIAQEEIFGPVLSVISANSFEEALEIANAVEQGLSSSIYTRDLSRALKFIDKTEVGLTHVNLPTSYKEPQLPFGGIKASGAGLPEAGKSGIKFFTEHKTIYLKYE